MAPPGTRRAERAADVAFGGLVALGAGLRLWQYLGRDSFFLDEVAILRNVAEQSWLGLVDHPLDYDQLAPPGFLLAEKLATTLAGWSEYAGRLFPLLCSVAGVAAFAFLARRLLSRPAAIAAVAVFATAGPLVFFAAQVKQYSTDVLAACLLLLAATELLVTPRPRATARFGALAVVLVWFSQPVVFVFAGIGLVLGPGALRRARLPTNRADRQVVVAMAVGALAAGASVLVAKNRLTASGKEFMHDYWADGFPPHGVAGWLGRPWPFAQALDLFGSASSNSFAYPAAPLFLVAAVAGLLLLGRRGPAGRMVVAPVLIAVAAGAAGQYPLSARLAFFLVPSLVLALAAAVERLAAGLKDRRASAAALALLAAAASYPVLTTLPTYHRHDLRPVLEHLAADRRPGRRIFLYYGISPAFWYYAPSMGLVDDALVVGRCHRDDHREYLRELDALRGEKSVVVVLGFPDPGARTDILGYLDTIGVRGAELRSSQHWFTRTVDLQVEAIEYDLSDPDRLFAARADAFPLQPYDQHPRVACDRGPISMPYTRVHP